MGKHRFRSQFGEASNDHGLPFNVVAGGDPADFAPAYSPKEMNKVIYFDTPVPLLGDLGGPPVVGVDAQMPDALVWLDRVA